MNGLFEGLWRKCLKIPVLPIGPEEADVAMHNQVGDLWTSAPGSKLTLEFSGLTLAQ